MIQKFKQDDSETLVIAIDGAGQQAYQTPYLVRDTKHIAGLPQIAMHLMGVQVYEVCNLALIDFNEFSHNTNHVCSVLTYTLETVIKFYKKKYPNKKVWPKQLFLQLDNAGGQNKNQYMFQWAGLLVKLGIFESVFNLF
jgi:hypothetical protein